MPVTSLRSASKASANSARKSSRREVAAGSPHTPSSLRAKRSNPEPQGKTGLLRRFAPRNDEYVFKDISHETLILSRLAVRPQSAHRRDRTRADRQDRVRAGHRGPGHAE